MRVVPLGVAAALPVVLLAGCAGLGPAAPDALQAALVCDHQRFGHAIRCADSHPLLDAGPHAPPGWHCISETPFEGYLVSVWRQLAQNGSSVYGVEFQGAPPDHYGMVSVAGDRDANPQPLAFFHAHERFFVPIGAWPAGANNLDFVSYTFRVTGAPEQPFGQSNLRVRGLLVDSSLYTLLQFPSANGVYTFDTNAKATILGSTQYLPTALNASGAAGHVEVRAGNGLSFGEGFEPSGVPQADPALEAAACRQHAIGP